MRDEIIEMVNPIDIVQRDCGIENAYFLDELRFSLMDVVYEWASGTVSISSLIMPWIFYL